MLVVYDKGITLERINEIINPFASTWHNNDSTNCYAYALGIDLSKEEIYPLSNLNPGTFSGHFLGNPFSTKDLLTYIDEDLYCLGLKSKEVDYDYKLEKGEWKIAVMKTSDFNNGICDYHFLRQVSPNKWMHKKGFYTPPTNLDSRGKIIINPVDSAIETDGLFSSTKYDYINTLCLTKK